jgi:hypothetical protein
MAPDPRSLTSGEKQVLLMQVRSAIGETPYDEFVRIHGEDTLLGMVLNGPAGRAAAEVREEEWRKRRARIEKLREIRNWLVVCYGASVLGLVWWCSFPDGRFRFSWSWWYAAAGLPLAASVVGIVQLIKHIDVVMEFLAGLKQLVILCIWVPGVGVGLASWLADGKSYGWLTAEGAVYLVVIGPICWAIAPVRGIEVAWRVNAIGSWLVGLGMIVKGLMEMSAK